MFVNINGTSAGSTYTKNADYRYIRGRNLGLFAEIGLQTTLTTKLQSENMVCIILHVCMWKLSNEGVHMVHTYVLYD